MCCTRLTGNTGRKNDAKNRHLRTVAQLCPATSSQLRHVLTIRKNVKQQYLLQTCSQYGELRPTNAWDLLANFEHPNKFQRVSRFGFITASTSLNGGQPNSARCLAISWAGTLYKFIYFRGLGGHHVGHRPTFYTVSQKTSQLWFAIIVTLVNAFLYFLAEILPIK